MDGLELVVEIEIKDNPALLYLKLGLSEAKLNDIIFITHSKKLNDYTLLVTKLWLIYKNVSTVY